MPDDIDLGNLGHAFEIVIAAKCGRQDRVDTRFLDIELWQTISDAARLRPLEDQRLVLRRMLCDFLNAHNLRLCGQYILNTLPFRQTLFRDILDRVAKTVEFPQRRVNIWRDPDTGKFVVDDRRRENFVLRHQIVAECTGSTPSILKFAIAQDCFGSNEVLNPTFGTSFSRFIQ